MTSVKGILTVTQPVTFTVPGHLHILGSLSPCSVEAAWASTDGRPDVATSRSEDRGELHVRCEYPLGQTEGLTLAGCSGALPMVSNRTVTGVDWDSHWRRPAGEGGRLRLQRQRCAAERREQRGGRGAQTAGEVAASRLRSSRGRGDARAPCGAAAFAAAAAATELRKTVRN